jgi:hypothetical protein
MFIAKKEAARRRPDSPARSAGAYAYDAASLDEWVSELNDVRRDIANARARFNMATEGELIDQCVYELNALQSRQTYFMRLIRESTG